MIEEDMFLGGLKDLENLQSLNPNPLETKKTYSKQWSMVVIRDSSLNTNSNSDFSVFPPSNHENLIPSHFNPPPPSSPSSTFSSLSSPPSDLDPPTSLPSVSLVPRWWGFALRILRSKIANVGSCFGGSVNGKTFWSFGNVGLGVVAVVLWWLCVRVRRRWRQRESVGHLLQIIREKDEVTVCGNVYKRKMPLINYRH